MVLSSCSHQLGIRASILAFHKQGVQPRKSNFEGAASQSRPSEPSCNPTTAPASPIPREASLSPLPSSLPHSFNTPGRGEWCPERQSPFDFFGNTSDCTRVDSVHASQCNPAVSQGSMHSDTGASPSCAGVTLRSTKESTCTRDMTKDVHIYLIVYSSVTKHVLPCVLVLDQVPAVEMYLQQCYERMNWTLGTVQSLPHRTFSNYSSVGFQMLRRTKRDIPFGSLNEWSTSRNLTYEGNADIRIEVEAVDALVQLQGAGNINDAGTQWAERGDDADSRSDIPASRGPWQPSAAGKKIMNREPVLNVQAAMQQMQTYLMDNSYIKVFKSEQMTEQDETVRFSTISSRTCKYLLFFGATFSTVAALNITP